MSAEYPPAKKPKFIDVCTGLRDFALVTYAVCPERLGDLLPDGLEPDVFTLSSGNIVAFVSAAMFYDVGFHPAFAPWPKFSFGQTNYRAYIKRGDSRAVWFFGTALHTPFVLVPRYLWRLPWHYTDIEISSSWQDQHCESFRYEANGAWGNAQVELAGTPESTGRLDGFADEEETALVLTHPLVGYYRRTDGVVGTYGIWHERLEMQRAVVQSAKFEVFEQLGLISEDTEPHSALIQQSTEFIIYLPPRVM